MKNFLFYNTLKFKKRYILLLVLFLFCSKNYSQEQFLLRYYGPANCLSQDCVVIMSNYYLSGNTLIYPTLEYNGYIIFDKFPTYIELVTQAETGFNCDWRSPSTCNDRISLKPTDCDWVISNKVLAEPDAVSNSFCEKVTLVATGCTGTQKFYWEYSTDGINYTKTNVSTSFNQNYDFIKANFPALNSYLGNIYFRALIDWDPNVIEDNIYSNVAPYKIISCSPALDGNPIASAVKCANESSGSVLITLKETIPSNQKLLLNLFKGNVFQKHIFVSSSEIINKQFTWNDIPVGTYTIKYQAQSSTDNSVNVGTLPVITPSFTIDNITPLTFKLTPLPLCSNGALEVTVEAFGGTSPYYYILDNETEIVNGNPVEKKHEFSGAYNIPISAEGAHTVKVTDKNNCIEKKL